MAFEAYFLNQGRVDAILLICDGEAAFIDSGFRSNGLKCVKFLKKLDVKKLKCYIGSHGHKNHIGGASVIIEAFSPGVVYVNRPATQNAIITHALKGAEKQAAKNANYRIVKVGDSFNLGSAVINFIGPLKLKNCSAGAYGENYNSLIFKVKYGDRTMLLTGDTSSSILTAVNKKNPGSICAEILKNAHHGGRATEAVLKKIKPQITILSNNALPSSAYQKLLKKIGSKWYATCKKGSGNVRVWTDGDGWRINENC